jgi:hypothetical protein
LSKKIKNPTIVILTYTNIMDVSNNFNALEHERKRVKEANS